MTAKLAIVAGGGELPRRLVAAARSAGREVLVIGLRGQVDAETLAMAPSMTIPMGSVSQPLARLREEGIQEIVFAGKVRRPTLREIRPDWMATKFLARIGIKSLGDDSLLKLLNEAIEGQGFRVIAPADLLGDLLAPAGCLGRHAPDQQAEEDIRRGIEVARALGAADVGQAVIVQQGIVLGLEAAEGTDALIRRCGALARPGPGGVLVKMKKPQQQRRNDLPVLGLQTLQEALAAGLRGLAVQAGGTLLLDLKEMVELADKEKIFIIGFEA